MALCFVWPCHSSWDCGKHLHYNGISYQQGDEGRLPSTIHSVFHVQVLLTTRNIFIVNLAMSDLLLCTITMPLTLADITTKYWPFGADSGMVKSIYGITKTFQILLVTFNDYPRPSKTFQDFLNIFEILRSYAQILCLLIN